MIIKFSKSYRFANISRRRTMIAGVAVMGGLVAGMAGPLAIPTKEMRTVRVTEGTELVAKLSPDGNKIAFIVMGEVFVIDRRGGDATRVMHAATEATVYMSLSWSPDSKWLEVSRGPRGSTAEALVVELATGATRVVVSRTHNSAVWTPDGRDILVAIPSGDSTRFMAYPVNRGAPARRVASVRGNRVGLTYSPDGSHVAYTSPPSEVDLATGQVRMLGDSAGGDYPTYSPDGNWIAFLSERSGSRQVWLAPRTGGTPRPLTRDADDVYRAPLSWTRDGKKVLYTAAGQLRLASVGGDAEETVPFSAEFTVARWTNMRRLEFPEPGATLRAKGIVHPQLSPDGKTVVFGALGDLWLASVAGGPPRRLTNTPWADEIFPRWSPDGTQIVFIEDVLGQPRRLRIIERNQSVTFASTSASRIIAAPALLGRAVEWSPDGRRLAFMAGDDIGWIDVASGDRRVLASTTRSFNNLVGWSGDGGRIIYTTVRVAADTVGGFHATHTLRGVAATDSGRVEEWKAPGSYAVRGAWTSDLAWAAFDSAGVGYYVHVADARPRRIPDPAPRHFSWSKNGRTLLYLSGERIRLLDVASGVARTLDVAPTYRVAPAPPPLVIRNVRVIDGRGSAPSAPADVFISGGRIARIAPTGKFSAPRGTRAIDGAGRTLLPGLVDAHVHQTDGTPVAPTYVYHGVLAVRDVGTGVEWMRAQRERAEAGGVIAPRIFLSGGLLVTDVGNGFEPTLRDHREVDATDSVNVARHIDALMSVGSDVLKFNIRDTRLEATASRLGHARGQRLTSHYAFASTFAEGLDGKEHAGLYFGTTGRWRQDLIAMTRAAGTCVTPTLSLDAFGGLRGRWPVLPLDSTLLEAPATRAFVSPEALEWDRSLLRTPLSPTAFRDRERQARERLETVRELAKAGVPLMSGTDVGYQGISLHVELELLVKAGLTPLEAIRTATYAPAQCLGVDHALGSVEPGKLADLILVDGDPSTDIRSLRRLALVVLAGQPYTREEIMLRKAPTPGR
jgi:Tol biopolymer transport system component